MDDAVVNRDDDQQLAEARGDAVQRLLDLTPDAVDALARNLTCGEPHVEVQAADVILRAQRELGKAYSFKGHISNRTDLTLVFKSKDGPDADWKVDPPEIIGPGGTGDFTTSYDGFNHTGEVVYGVEGVDDGGEFVVKWKIPLFGNNKISQSTTISGTSARHEGGRGWHAEVWYYLEVAR